MFIRYFLIISGKKFMRKYSVSGAEFAEFFLTFFRMNILFSNEVQ